MTDNFHAFVDVKVIKQCNDISRHNGFGESIVRLGRLARTAVVGSYYTVAGVCKCRNEVAELIACLREAVKEDYRPFGFPMLQSV